jgi:hypothetical protein
LDSIPGHAAAAAVGDRQVVNEAGPVIAPNRREAGGGGGVYWASDSMLLPVDLAKLKRRPFKRVWSGSFLGRWFCGLRSRRMRRDRKEPPLPNPPRKWEGAEKVGFGRSFLAGSVIAPDRRRPVEAWCGWSEQNPA